MTTNGPARNLIGGLLHTGRGSTPGVHVVKEEDSTMAKAEHDGVYSLNGSRFKARKGEILPDGAVMDPAPEERAEPAAPENKAAKAAPENRAKGKDA